MSKPKPHYDHTKLMEACVTYTYGVFAVLALINEARWDGEKRELRAGVKFQLGRRMTTSEKNPVSPSCEVTPDCVVQPDVNAGLVAEAKLGLPRDVDLWDEDVLQLRKYDDDLTGWWTTNGKIGMHDIIGLVPLERAVRFSDHVETLQKREGWNFERRWAVVGFFHQSGVKDFLTLKKERGTLSDPVLDDKLRNSVPVGIEHLIVGYKDRKFLDHDPPLPFVLQIIWDHLFTLYAADAQPDEKNDGVQIKVTASKVTRDLQDYFGSTGNEARSPEIPRSRLVLEALDALVDFRMAARTAPGEFVVTYKRSRGDVLKKFGRLCFKRDYRLRKRSANSAPLLIPDAFEPRS